MQSFRFHPVIARWFEQKFGSPTEPQQRGWPAIQSGAHTLIAAPTGSGKDAGCVFCIAGPIVSGRTRGRTAR